jgi:hypothetical protein
VGAAQIDDWGRDNDFVRVNVLGLFPLRGSDKLLRPDEVRLAISGTCRRARSRRSVGLGARPGAVRERPFSVQSRLGRWRSGPRRVSLDGVDLASRVSHVLTNATRRPDYLFVDVAGVGASVFDQLGVLGWQEIMEPVDFGGAAQDARYGNRRAEMWSRMAGWVRKRGCLPSDSSAHAREHTAPAFRNKVVGKRTAFYLGR